MTTKTQTSSEVINRTMDPADLEAPRTREICEELNALIVELRRRGLRVSSWYGLFGLSGKPGSYEVINRGPDYRPIEAAADDQSFPWFLYWEIAWVMLNNDIRPGMKLLDLGGASSLFSYYLASKGVDVTAVDLNPDLVANGNEVAKAMGWKLRNVTMDMRALELDGTFDHITSICVFEHIPMVARLEISSKIRDLLSEGGRFSITFDYVNPSRFARIGSPEEVERQFVVPSGLTLRGNRAFVDNGQRYLLHPFYSPRSSLLYKLRGIARGHFGWRDILRVKDRSDYTFGALFMEKTGGSTSEG